MADNYRGKAMLVINSARGVIRGATLVGPDIGESLHAATIAVAAAVPREALWHAVPSVPTMFEAWLNLVEAALKPSD